MDASLSTKYSRKLTRRAASLTGGVAVGLGGARIMEFC